MRRALVMLRDDLPYRKQAFCEGLQALGYTIVDDITDPTPEDCLLVWNRYDIYEHKARLFSHHRARVYITENGYVGLSYYALSMDHHNGRGRWHVGGPERWDAMGIDIAPWREGGTEVVLLPQRGIGAPAVRMPDTWIWRMLALYPRSRVRMHPATTVKNKKTPLELEIDLANAKHVVTWGSGAALKALLLGIPVDYELSEWIGAPAAGPIGSNGSVRGDRLAMFRRLAWAQWSIDEIRSGLAFNTLEQG